MLLRRLHDQPPESVSHDPTVQKKVLLRRGDVPHVMQYARSVLPPGENTSPHAHADMWEVFLVEAGAGEAMIDGIAYPLVAGTCLTVAPGEVHVLHNTGASDLVLTYFGVA